MPIRKIRQKRDQLATKAGKAIKKATDKVRNNPKKAAAAAGIEGALAAVSRAAPVAGKLAARAAGGIGGAFGLGFAAGKAIESKTGIGKKIGSAKFDADQKIARVERRKNAKNVQKRRVERVNRARRQANKK